MHEGVLIGVVLAAWSFTGWTVAVHASRRGHFLPAWIVLGTLFGPFTISLWRASRDRHGDAHPHAIDPGRAGPGDVHVVVGIDGSPESRAALLAAVDLLGDRLGRLTLATVIDYDTALDRTDTAAERDRSRAIDALHTASALVGPASGVVPAEVTLAGRASDALRSYAVDRGCSLIVIGPRGHGVSKALLGSTAASLAERCPVPVLIVGGSGGARA